jgi:hypothetical protein
MEPRAQKYIYGEKMKSLEEYLTFNHIVPVRFMDLKNISNNE